MPFNNGVRHQESFPLHATNVSVSEDPDRRSATLVVPTEGLSLQALERAFIVFALERHAGNRTHAARFLHVSRSALLYRIRKYRLNVPPASHGAPGAKE